MSWIEIIAALLGLASIVFLVRHGQDLLAAAAQRKAGALLILDTDAVMTAIWSDILVGHRPEDLDRVDDPADLYLLCDVDGPFVADGIRYFPDQPARERMFAQTRAELERRGLPFIVIRGTGDERRRNAIDAITKEYPELA